MCALEPRRRLRVWGSSLYPVNLVGVDLEPFIGKPLHLDLLR